MSIYDIICHISNEYVSTNDLYIFTYSYEYVYIFISIHIYIYIFDSVCRWALLRTIPHVGACMGTESCICSQTQPTPGASTRHPHSDRRTGSMEEGRLGDLAAIWNSIPSTSGWMSSTPFSFLAVAKEAHNAHRKNHSAPPLQWMDECYLSAKKQANLCQENLACCGGLKFHGQTSNGEDIQHQDTHPIWQMMTHDEDGGLFG